MTGVVRALCSVHYRRLTDGSVFKRVLVTIAGVCLTTATLGATLAVSAFVAAVAVLILGLVWTAYAKGVSSRVRSPTMAAPGALRTTGHMFADA